MRILFLILIICMISCNQQAQENSSTLGNEFVTNLQETEFDIVKIDLVPDIEKGIDERSSSFIKNRLQALVGNFVKIKCEKNGLKDPPKFILYRFFKLEREFEVWAGNSRNDSLKRILLLPVCAVDDQPGTKLQEGDGKTPEGFYYSPLQYGSTADFMWIKLNNSELSTYGKVGYGSSFKMCLDYPNSLDRLQTKTIMKNNNPGSAICIHGNCVSIGCISFKNENYLPVFLTAIYHNSMNYGPINIHIFPFRFEKINAQERQKFAKNVIQMTENQVVNKWNNLEQGYTLFNKNRKAFKINIVKNKYSYSSF